MKGVEKFSVAVIAAFFIAVLILLLCYAATFWKWNLSPSALYKINSAVSKVPLILIGIGVLALIVVVLFGRMLGLSLPLPSQPILTAFGWTAVFVVLLTGYTAFSNKRVSLAFDGERVQVKQHAGGVWETVSAASFEKSTLQNLRRHLCFTMLGLLLCTGAVLAQPKQANQQGANSQSAETHR